MDTRKLLPTGLILALLALPAVWIVTSLVSAPTARAAVLPPVSTVCKVPSSSNDGTLTVNANGQGEKGETAIVLSVVDSGATVTLKDVRDALLVSGNGSLLTVDPATHIWTLARSLLVKEGVTLRIAGGAAVPAGERVDWLRMRSDPGSGSGYDYSAFAPLRVRDATLVLSNTRLTSWDTAAGAFDTNYGDGRAYVLAKGEARLDIAASELSYLGSADGESYGVSWRDNEFVGGDPRTCVTGDVTDSVFSNNYYGVYTFQAANMQFLRNTFRDNVQYGFDPHDYTHDVLVEGNVAEGNGNHGFIISRGCFNFIFRNNISRNNKLKAGSANPSAHGFMLDPGSPNSGDPQSPSVANVFENNQAYGNDGYAFRILGSDDNTIKGNTFYNNRLGITLEDGSTGNQIVGNQVLSSTGILVNNVLSQGYGISLNGGSDGNTIDGNTVRGNRNAGIYVRVGSTVVKNNVVDNNGADGITVLPESGTLSIPAEGPADDYVLPGRAAAPTPAAVTPPNNNQLSANTARGNAGNGLTVKGADGTQVTGNTFSGNAADGISIANSGSTPSTDTLVQANTVAGNAVYGIEVYGGTGVTRNTLTQNSVTGNGNNGISVRNSANDAITAPGSVAVIGNTLRGITRPNARVEVFSDAGSQAANYEGFTTADGTGFWSFTIASAPAGAYLTATATDGASTSGLSTPVAYGAAPTPQPTNTPPPEPTEAPTATATPRPRVLLPVVTR
jgi:parallel beta-helix repeat protein